MKRPKVLVGLLLVAGLSACRGNDPEAVALFQGGRVTLEQVDRAVLATPMADRPVGEDVLPWLRQLTRQLAVERLLLAQAQAEATEISLADAELERQVVVEVFLEGLTVEPVSEAEIGQLYQQRRGDFSEPERRQVRHIFRRLPPGENARRVEGHLLNLREQLLKGAAFAELAASESQSESRHQGGLLGWLQRGDLDRSMEAVIFSLTVGVPSQPVAGPGGLHLFQVEEIRPATVYSLDEVRPQLLAELQAAHRTQALNRALDESGESLADRVDLHERIYRHGVDRGLHRSAEVERRLEERRERALIDGQLHRSLRELASAESERLERFFQDHQNRYSTPLLLNLRRLRVPLADAGTERMALLEAARRSLDRGDETFEALAARLDGEVEVLGRLTLQQVRQLPGRAAPLALALGVGAHSAPYLVDDGLEMLLLHAREEPRIQAFPEVRDRILNDYVAQHAQRLYAQLSEELLVRANYRDLAGRLESLVQLPEG